MNRTVKRVLLLGMPFLLLLPLVYFGVIHITGTRSIGISQMRGIDHWVALAAQTEDDEMAKHYLKAALSSDPSELFPADWAIMQLDDHQRQRLFTLLADIQPKWKAHYLAQATVGLLPQGDFDIYN